MFVFSKLFLIQKSQKKKINFLGLTGSWDQPGSVYYIKLKAFLAVSLWAGSCMSSCQEETNTEEAIAQLQAQ